VNRITGAVGALHATLVHRRRVRVLASHLTDLLPQQGSVLDVGCGDGFIAETLMHARPSLRIEGIDVLVRPATHVPVKLFDGTCIPFSDSSFDAVMFVDVLHHTADPARLLSEARRVARQCIVLKDHSRDGLFAGARLRFMDFIGNAHHGVALPYNYWTTAEWEDAYAALGLRTDELRTELGLYPGVVSPVFDARLHFAARLVRR
jgi:SAM-dependent methyltransferase